MITGFILFTSTKARHPVSGAFGQLPIKGHGGNFFENNDSTSTKV